jgi:hypothetical protein
MLIQSLIFLKEQMTKHRVNQINIMKTTGQGYHKETQDNYPAGQGYHKDAQDNYPL